MSLLLYLAVFFMSAMSFIIRTTLSVSCRTGCHVMFRFHPISGEIPPSSPLSSSNLQPRNRQLSSIWNRLRVKGTTSVFGDLQQHHSTECSARCHVRVSSSPPPGFDSDRVKLQKTFVPLNIRNKWSRVSRLFEGTENGER